MLSIGPCPRHDSAQSSQTSALLGLYFSHGSFPRCEPPILASRSAIRIVLFPNNRRHVLDRNGQGQRGPSPSKCGRGTAGRRRQARVHHDYKCQRPVRFCGHRTSCLSRHPACRQQRMNHSRESTGEGAPDNDRSATLAAKVTPYRSRALAQPRKIKPARSPARTFRTFPSTSATSRVPRADISRRILQLLQYREFWIDFQHRPRHGFGVISKTAEPSRQIQFSLKLAY